jgi:hypothetical protein
MLVNEVEAGDTDLTVHEKVPSALDEVLKEIFKQMEVQQQDSHCEHSDSHDSSDVVNTNHNRPLPIHKEALQTRH